MLEIFFYAGDLDIVIISLNIQKITLPMEGQYNENLFSNSLHVNLLKTIANKTKKFESFYLIIIFSPDADVFGFFLHWLPLPLNASNAIESENRLNLFLTQFNLGDVR